jgi:hypothetical protein
MVASTCGFSSPTTMPRIYSGAPARDRSKRAAIPRPKRREIKEANGKENMHVKATQLRDTFNKDIDSLAQETGFARSTVAAVAHGGKKPVFHRGPNLKNAWVSGRMKEENSSKCFSILSPPFSFFTQDEDQATSSRSLNL